MQFGRRFYERFFELAPDTRAMFGADMSAQHVKFTGIILQLVNLHLRSMIALPAVGGQAAIPAFVELGRHHAALGVRPEHFASMRIALIETLREELANNFTAAVQEAWEAAFDVIVKAMQHGLTDLPPSQERFLDRFEREGNTVRRLSQPGVTTLDQFFR